VIETPPVIQNYIEGLEAHDVGAVARTVSEDAVFISAGRTLDKQQFLDMLKALWHAFPDWHYQHSEPELQDEVIAIRWRQGGTHTGPFEMPGLDPIAPTGRDVRIPEHDFFYKVQDDRIAEIRPDPIPGGAPRGILEQIGVHSPPL
jgi:predicted ester cyclase